MRKRIFWILGGILFTGIVGYNILVCLVAGITPFEGAAAEGYLLKAMLLSIALPLALYGFSVMIWYITGKNQQYKKEINRLEGEVKEYHRMAKKGNSSHSGEVPAPQLSSSFTSKKSLDEAEVEELLKYLEEL